MLKAREILKLKHEIGLSLREIGKSTVDVKGTGVLTCCQGHLQNLW